MIYFHHRQYNIYKKPVGNTCPPYPVVVDRVNYIQQKLEHPVYVIELIRFDTFLFVRTRNP